MPEARSAVLLFGGYPPKLSTLARLFQKYGRCAIALSPNHTTTDPDEVVELLDSQNWALDFALPLVDCAVALADCLNTRLGKIANDPATSAWRRDKFLQQEALRKAGLSAARQIRTASVEAAVDFAEGLFPEVPVVVKPADASGGDGVWLCSSAAELREAFASEIGRPNVERSSNSELIVAEALTGEEWIVNTISRDSHHVVTDVWRGPAKLRVRGACGEQFVYDHQFLELPCEGFYQGRAEAVVKYAAAALNACEHVHGAAHTELVWVDGRGPHLFEINARCAGGLPRVRQPSQLDVLATSVCKAEAFFALPAISSRAPAVQQSKAEDGKAVVFLQAPFDGWLRADALAEIVEIPTFWRFDRGLFGVNAPYQHRPVKATAGLFSSPGAVILSGCEEHLNRDIARLRSLETTAYSAEPPDKDKPEQ